MITGKQVPTSDQLFWGGNSDVPGLPATIMLIGPTSHGLTVGGRIIVRVYADLTCIAFAGALGRAIAGLCLR